jgi:hypothetical protein
VFRNCHALITAKNPYSPLDDLNMPRGDADSLADLLREHFGFDVIRLNDTTR